MYEWHILRLVRLLKLNPITFFMESCISTSLSMRVNNSKTLLAIYSWSVLSSWLLGIIFLFLSRIIYFLLQCYHAWFYEDEIWLRRVQKIRLRLKAQDPVKLKAHCYKSGREPKSLEARLHVVPEVIPGATCFVLGTIICAWILA
jgi:hypothetical protein